MVDSGPGSTASRTRRAASELQALEERGEAARDALMRLDEQIEQASQALAGTRAARLQDTNEQLLISILQARAAAERCEESLLQAARAAERDELTGLPNRMLLMDRLMQAIAHARRCQSRVAVLFLDLDNFKLVNDSYGHAAGDAVLCHVAACLTAAVREEDTVSRHGGDEFLILLPEIDTLADAGIIAGKLLAALAEPLRIGEHDVALAACIGISVFPDDASDAVMLIEHADAAMYQAKGNGDGCFAWYGSEPPPEKAAVAPVAVSRARKLVEQAARNAQLREANASLVMAAIGAQKLQAAAQSAQDRQGGVLSMVAHELRNPLTPIRMAAGLLGRAQPGTVVQVREIIEQEVVHMMRLIDDLLDVSRANIGKLRLDRVKVDLSQIIAGAIGACRPAMDMRRQRLVVDVPEPLPMLHGDPIRLGQVLRNLLDNASKYTPDGGRIVLSVVGRDHAVEITVADDGIGISADALPAVFNPFVQDAHAVVFNGSGLGIGLTLVRELVDAHGGTVTASSAGTGSGSRFVVSLPLPGEGGRPPELRLVAPGA
jgi:diguanylate cyclase (GGDEF)-like protein